MSFQGRGRRGGRGYRSAPYPANDDDETPWSHDKFASIDSEFAEDGEAEPAAKPTPVIRGSAALTSGGSGAGGGAGGTKVLLENLHVGVTKEDLQELLGSFGELISVRLTYNASGHPTGEAVAIFRDAAGAKKAVAECDGRTLDGKVMTLSLAQRGGAGALGGRLSGRLGPKVGDAGGDEANNGERASGRTRNAPSFTVSLSGLSSARGGRRADTDGGAFRTRRGGGGSGGTWSAGGRGGRRGFGARTDDDDDDEGASNFDQNESSGFGYRGRVAGTRGRGLRGDAGESRASARGKHPPGDAASLDAELDAYMAKKS